jgi:hypothetical protein
MRSRHRVLFFALLMLWVVGSGPRGAGAYSSHVCDELCTNGANCEAECWRTQFEFDQAYPSTTCGNEGYDCCGNGECNPGVEACNVCPSDCGYVSGCSSPECYSNNQCGYGEVCNAARECVPSTPGQSPPSPHPPCGGSCTSNSDCCGADVCLGGPGPSQKYCGIPETTYCPSAPECSSNLDCNFAEHCDEHTENTRAAFCDPGIWRCMFIQGFDCPDTDGAGKNVCTPKT